MKQARTGSYSRSGLKRTSTIIGQLLLLLSVYWLVTAPSDIHTVERKGESVKRMGSAEVQEAERANENPRLVEFIRWSDGQLDLVTSVAPYYFWGKGAVTLVLGLAFLWVGRLSRRKAIAQPPEAMGTRGLGDVNL